MSKAFTKDDDAGELPVVLPRRATLPEGMPNYVTQPGLARLRGELAMAELATQQALDSSTSTSDAERARTAALHSARLAELEQRIATAVLVDSAQQPRGEVRFGATVKVRNSAGQERIYTLVGVDEADAAAGAIAFMAPLARALLGKSVGETALVKTPAGEDELEILAIDYG